MPSLLDRAGRRNLTRNPWQLILAVAGIALGVAVVVGVDMANSSVERAFAASSELVTGRATHQVIPVQGTLPDALYVALRTEAGIDRAAPVLEASVVLSGAPDSPLTLQGIDVFAEAPFRSFAGTGTLDVEALLLEPGAAVLPYGLAERLGVTVGDRVPLKRGGALRVAGVLTRDDVDEGLSDGFAIVDIASAQELLDAVGRLSRIDLILSAGDEARVQQLLGDAQLLVTTGPRTNAMLQMTRGFRTNLTAMSLMALLVGAFLIYNTMAFLVVRRVPITGMFRALGVTRRQVFVATLKEALTIGLAGSALGLVLGALLGTGLVALALRTVDDLYFSVAAAPAALDGWVLAKGAALGLIGTVLAAAAPAWEASTAA
ncbi:MAG: FtsX-like permease family protein, partial [Pseudomonadota bacterium]